MGYLFDVLEKMIEYLIFLRISAKKCYVYSSLKTNLHKFSEKNSTLFKKVRL